MPLAVALTKVTEASIQQIEPGQVSFVAQPEQCVSLRQGRNCFASIKLEWQADTKQSLCLYQYGHKKEIACWQDDKTAQFEFEFESDETVIYQLRSLKNEQVIAQTQVKVSWLHKKSSRKKRWRLF